MEGIPETDRATVVKVDRRLAPRGSISSMDETFRPGAWSSLALYKIVIIIAEIRPMKKKLEEGFCCQF